MLIISTKGWDFNSIDTKSVFLQSKEIRRNVSNIPPMEAESENVAWRLNSCTYDLVDVLRNLYLPVKDELTKIGVKTSKYDPAVFYYYVKNELQGMIAANVDTFCQTDNPTFIDDIISPIEKIFNIGFPIF